MELVNKLFALAQDLAKSQGFYGRLLRTLQEMTTDDLQDLENRMEQELGLHADNLDIILWIEG